MARYKSYRRYVTEQWVAEKVTSFALWLIRLVNRGIDPSLSEHLHYHAEAYNKRPGTNNYTGLVEPPKWYQELFE